MKKPKPCAHCGERPATETFRLTMCAEGRRRRSVGLCDPCDVEINRLVLTFVRSPTIEADMAAYEARPR